MTDLLKSKIAQAFSDVEYPGDWCLKGSMEGDEPYRVEKEFKGKTDWRVLDPEFLDRAPGGLGSALSFFSDEAFRFYLPAYLLADIDGKLEFCDLAYRLTGQLEKKPEESGVINRKRYGDRTWWDYMTFRLSVFSREQCSAIAEYLRFKLESPDSNKFVIEKALEHYWDPRAKGIKV
ncbi:MAG: hypothetical protein PHV33_12770 [Elusimicrobiales bacterium]|nr:hypothetical protein [Elusimicrobiales bacterium]